MGRYRGVKAGHAATNKLLRKLLATPMAFEMVTCDEPTAKKLPGVGVSLRDISKAA